MNIDGRIQRGKPLPWPPEFYEGRAIDCEKWSRERAPKEVKARYRLAALQWRAWAEEAKLQRA